MAAKVNRSQEELDEIWKNIKEGTYKSIVQKLEGLVVFAPERLFSDEGGDAMSIPIGDGTDRDCYRRKPKSKKWEIF